MSSSRGGGPGPSPGGGGGHVVNTNNNTRIQVRTTQTAGDPVVDSQWTVVYDTGGIPRPLIVSSVQASTPENAPITIALSAVDPNAGASITFVISTSPKNGTLSPITNNTITYTPNNNFQGIDIFTVTASDQTGLTSAPAVMTITVGTPPVTSMGTVAVTNQSTQATDAQVQQWVAAVQDQVNNDVASKWGRVDMVFVPKGTTPPAADWIAGVFDTTNQAGAIGWHAVGRNGEPLIEIFVATAKQAGVDPASVLSHEIIESIGDPNADTIVQNCLDSQGRACVMFQELCDPVENDSYQDQGVNVSNFALKSWFSQAGTAPFDQLGKVTKPFQMTSGGYMEVSYDGGRTWGQETQAAKFGILGKKQQEEPKFGTMAYYRSMIGEYSRWEKYKTPKDQRKRSTFTLS